MVQHEAVVIGLGEGGSLLADVSSLFGSCCDCSGQNNLEAGADGFAPNSSRAKPLGPSDLTSARTMSIRLEPSSRKARAIASAGRLQHEVAALAKILGERGSHEQVLLGRRKMQGSLIGVCRETFELGSLT